MKNTNKTDLDPVDYSKYKPCMAPNEVPSKLNTKRTLTLSLSFFTVLIAWAYFNLIMGAILDPLIPIELVSVKQTVKGAILAIDNLVAVMLQPFFGDLSDRTRSKFGRRMPYIIVGTLLGAFFFILLPIVKVLIGLILIIVCFDVSMAIYRSVAIAIVPDYTPDGVREKASAMQQFIANMGGVIAFAIPMILGFLIVSDDLVNMISFIMIAVIMVLVVIIQVLKIKETPTGEKAFQIGKNVIAINSLTYEVKEVEKQSEKSKTNVYKDIVTVFRQEDKSFRNMLLVVFFAYTAFAAVEAFFGSFAKFYMGKTTGTTSTLFLMYSIPMILTALVWGVVGQKIGRKNAVKLGLIGVIISTLIICFTITQVYDPPVGGVYSSSITSGDTMFMINLAFISMFWMCFIVNSFPIVWSLAPKGKLGSYTGVYYTFNQLAYSVAPIIAGIGLDTFSGAGAYQYAALFYFVLVCMIIAFIIMTRVKKGDVDLSQAEIKE